jgi:hypothetical protein
MRGITAAPLASAALALALLLAGAAPAAAQTDSTGGTTGEMTTTPEAKSDDAVGTGGTDVQPSPTTTEGAAAADHGCSAMQTWDAQQMACVEK